MSSLVAESLSVIVYDNTNSRQSFSGYDAGSESYTGPSSYTTSFQSDYPGYGNYGSTLNLKNPPITSSYSSFGPSSENKEFGSTTFVNYPPTYEHESSPPQNYERPSFASSQAWPAQATPSQAFSSASTSGSSYGEETPISQHVEVTKPIAVPIYKRFPYPVAKKFNVAIPHPVLGNFRKASLGSLDMTKLKLSVPYPAPYPVNVAISNPVAVPVFREIRIPIEREVLYPVEKKVPVTYEKPVQYQVEKHYPVYVPRPYPVRVII